VKGFTLNPRIEYSAKLKKIVCPVCIDWETK
jgi:hypothetical protein